MNKLSATNGKKTELVGAPRSSRFHPDFINTLMTKTQALKYLRALVDHEFAKNGPEGFSHQNRTLYTQIQLLSWLRKLTEELEQEARNAAMNTQHKYRNSVSDTVLEQDRDEDEDDDEDDDDDSDDDEDDDEEEDESDDDGE